MVKCLSLFGGMECGRIALEVLGITVESYHSSEFDTYPQKLSGANFPDIVHIGDVTNVSGFDYPDTDILFAWPPCQDLSIAGKRAGLEGSRSSLFYDFVRILNEAKPKFFLMENVASMPKEAKEEITAQLYGIEPVLINSALVSAQNRKRLFWVGKRNEDGTYSKVWVPQPEDRWLVLKDILEDIPLDSVDAKWNPIWKPLDTKYVEAVSKRIAGWSDRNERLIAYQSDAKRSTAAEHVYIKSEWKTDSCTVAHVPKMVTTTFSQKVLQEHWIHAWKICGRRVGEDGKRKDYEKDIPLIHRFETRESDGKSGTLATFDKDNVIWAFVPKMVIGTNDKEYALTATYANVCPQNHIKCDRTVILGQYRRTDLRIHADQDNSPTLTANMGTGGNNVPIVISDPYEEIERQELREMAEDFENRNIKPIPENGYVWRKLTVRECARLQTVPEWYKFDSVSNSRAYKAIGNGWTVEVICHILRHMNVHG